MRFLPSDTINDVIDAGIPFIGHGVAAFDLAGNEVMGFVKNMFPMLNMQRKRISNYVHAGEQGCGQNVLDAIELLGAERIGHGVAIQSHDSAYDRVREDLVGLKLVLVAMCRLKPSMN